MPDAAPSFAGVLMDMVEQLQPMIEVAEGQRKALEERGWSPTAAEQYATELLLGMTRACFKGAT